MKRTFALFSVMLCGMALHAGEIRIGIVGCDTSHVPALTESFNNPKGKSHVAGGKVVAAFKGGSPDVPSSAGRVEGFSKTLRDKYGVTFYDTIEGLCSNVDVVLLESVDGRAHLAQAKPVIAARKPMFIDKPMAASLQDVLEIFRLARAAKVPVWSSSSLRFAANTMAVREGKVGKVSFAETTSPCTLEEHHPELFWYGIHGVESLFTVMGTGCESVKRGTWTNGQIEATGTWAGKRTGIYREERRANYGENYHGMARGEKGEAAVGSFDGYEPLAQEIMKFFKTGVVPVTPDETIEIYAFMAAEEESKERGGAEVKLSDVLAKARRKSAAAGAPRLAGAPVNPIADLMLIYDGGEGRKPWTADRFRPFVYREHGADFKWLFDGYLFIDYIAKSGARFCPITRRKDAVKSDWQALMDHFFEEGQSIGALDQLLDSLAAGGHTPARKRKVVITLPTPFASSEPDRRGAPSNWGELDGRRMDFNNKADRIQAARWYVDGVLERWKRKDYKHLELAGFYWVFERAWRSHNSLEIGDYIRSRNSRLYWIPSWPQGRTNWPEYGFDFVYQQPNYFFHRAPTPADRLESACGFAERWGTGMEMEFNSDLLAKSAFQNYFDEYVKAYAAHEVWDKKPVAYYGGVDTWSEMARSSDPAVKGRYDALADIVARRQEAADGGFVFQQGVN